MRDGRNGYSSTQEFDFVPLGMAIKQAREARGITREQLAETIDYAPRHIQAIENEGQHPSLQLLIQLATMFNISIDQYLFPQRQRSASTLRRQVDAELEGLTEAELLVVSSTISGLKQARKHMKQQTISTEGNNV